MADPIIPRPSAHHSVEDHEDAIEELRIALNVLRQRSRRQTALLNSTLKRLEHLQREYDTYIRHSTRRRGPAAGQIGAVAQEVTRG